MKKIIFAVIAILVLAIASIYWLIPATLDVSAVAALHGTVTGANRTLLQKQNWKAFWVGEKQLTPDATLSSDDLFVQDEDTFRITKLLQNSLEITISNDDSQVKSILLTAPLNRDSIVLHWSYSTNTSANPLKRLQQYRNAVNIKKTMVTELQNIRQFLSNDEHIYGIKIEQTSTHDTTLVSTFSIVKTYPATADIYVLVNKLQAYINANKAIQTGSPMLNVTQLDSQQYKIMVALPTNKKLSEQGDITYKRMIPGMFLTTVVTGGNGTIENAYQQMQHFFADYQRTAMAIPFQVLVTDRTKQTDTTKWVTKLYFPVM